MVAKACNQLVVGSNIEAVAEALALARAAGVDHAKDARIVLETARRAGVDLPGFRPVAEGFQKLIARGDAGLDHSALITLLEEA